MSRAANQLLILSLYVASVALCSPVTKEPLEVVLTANLEMGGTAQSLDSLLPFGNEGFVLLASKLKVPPWSLK